VPGEVAEVAPRRIGFTCVVRAVVTFRWHDKDTHDGSLEGWYTDPYERHEARWMSQGTPTSLVRDGKVEGSDPVADEPFKVTPVRIESVGLQDGSDQRRADDAGVAYDSREPVRAAWDVFDQSEGGPLPLHRRWGH
jgi:hypothetical protein